MSNTECETKAKYVLYKGLLVPIGHGRYMLMPTGFAWDGASSVIDVCMSASGIHDWLYKVHDYNQVKILCNGQYLDVQISRKEADKIYRDILRSIGKPIVAWIRYLGLRILGGRSFRKHRPCIITANAHNYPVRECRHGIVALDANTLSEAPFSYLVL